MKQINMLDLRAEYDLFSDEVRKTAIEVLDSQRFIGGPAVGELEEALAERIGCSHAIAVNSGTDALYCSLLALGVGHGDEVILPTFTFVATAGSIARTGARPVFVDIDTRTFNIDPSAVEKAITAKTKAIMVVHLYGQCADMDRINAIAKKANLPVIEDACQAIEAKYNGQCACSLATFACLSFYPTKNLGGFGEGGMILTSDDELAATAKSLRNHGEAGRYICERIGGNFRLDTMKAAILLIKLKHLGEFTEKRRSNAAKYDQLLEGCPVQTPFVPQGHEPVYHQYSVLCDKRDELKNFLTEKQIGSVIYYPIPLHLQDCFSSLGYKAGDMPVAEETCGKILSLPCHPMLSKDDIHRVAATIHEFYGTKMPG